jgi:hypothetical protein
LDRMYLYSTHTAHSEGDSKNRHELTSFNAYVYTAYVQARIRADEPYGADTHPCIRRQVPLRCAHAGTLLPVSQSAASPGSASPSLHRRCMAPSLHRRCMEHFALPSGAYRRPRFTTQQSDGAQLMRYIHHAGVPHAHAAGRISP